MNTTDGNKANGQFAEVAEHSREPEHRQRPEVRTATLNSMINDHTRRLGLNLLNTFNKWRDTAAQWTGDRELRPAGQVEEPGSTTKMEGDLKHSLPNDMPIHIQKH